MAEQIYLERPRIPLMETYTKHDLSTASNKQLMDYLERSYQFPADLVREALAECVKREIPISDQLLREIEFNLHDQAQRPASPADNLLNPRDHYVTDDPEAPELYSKRAIRVSSILINPFFSSFLFAANVRRLGRSDGVAQIHGFGLFYTATVIYIFSQFEQLSGFAILAFNAGGAYFMNGYFWDKYIGKTTAYRKREVAMPVLFGIVVTVVVVICAIYGY
jgi:hypothetical protein